VPLGPFPVIDVSRWDIVADETSGAEEKYWLEEPETGVHWLFKNVTIKDGHVHGEDWAEKAVSHLAGLLGVPCARIELAHMNCSMAACYWKSAAHLATFTGSEDHPLVIAWRTYRRAS
jgi:hypothetical protein